MLHVQVWKIIVHIFSDGRQTHDGNCEHEDDIEMYDSMGKIEHVIFTIHSPDNYYIYFTNNMQISRMCYADMYKIVLYTINIMCLIFISDIILISIIYMFLICHMWYMYTYIYQ